MDIQAIIGQVMQAAGENPDLLGALGENPAEAIAGITGETLGGDQLSQVTDALGAVTGAEGFDPAQLLEAAQGFLGEGGLSEALSGIAEGGLGGVAEALGGAAEGGVGDAIGGILGGLFGNK